MAEHFSLRVIVDNSPSFLLFDNNSFKNFGIYERASIRGKLICNCLKSSRNLLNYSSIRSFFSFVGYGTMGLYFFIDYNGLASSSFSWISLTFTLASFSLSASCFPLVNVTNLTCSLRFSSVSPGRLPCCLPWIRLANLVPQGCLNHLKSSFECLNEFWHEMFQDKLLYWRLVLLLKSRWRILSILSLTSLREIRMISLA